MHTTHEPTGDVVVHGSAGGSVRLTAEEQRELVGRLTRSFGMVLISREVHAQLLAQARGTECRPPKPVGPALRVARYLEGRRTMGNLDQESIAGVFVHQEDEERELRASDLQALLDYIREA